VGLANLGSESEICVGSCVRLVGVSISFEKNFYQLPFTPPSLVLHIDPSGALSWRGGTVHDTPFMVLVLLQLERDGSLFVVTLVVFVEVDLVGKMFWIMLTPLLSKWLGTGFTL
jgi:hypothetical protein